MNTTQTVLHENLIKEIIISNINNSISNYDSFKYSIYDFACDFFSKNINKYSFENRLDELKHLITGFLDIISNKYGIIVHELDIVDVAHSNLPYYLIKHKYYKSLKQLSNNTGFLDLHHKYEFLHSTLNFVTSDSVNVIDNFKVIVDVIYDIIALTAAHYTIMSFRTSQKFFYLLFTTHELDINSQTVDFPDDFDYEIHIFPTDSVHSFDFIYAALCGKYKHVYIVSAIENTMPTGSALFDVMYRTLNNTWSKKINTVFEIRTKTYDKSLPYSKSFIALYAYDKQLPIFFLDYAIEYVKLFRYITNNFDNQYLMSIDAYKQLINDEQFLKELATIEEISNERKKLFNQLLIKIVLSNEHRKLFNQLLIKLHEDKKLQLVNYNEINKEIDFDDIEYKYLSWTKLYTLMLLANYESFTYTMYMTYLLARDFIDKIGSSAKLTDKLPIILFNFLIS